MNKKILLVIISLLLSLGLFLDAKAMTIAEIQTQIAELQTQISQLQAQLAQTQTDERIITEGSAWCHDFNTDLQIGNSGPDVEALQIALEKSGFTIDISEKSSKYFGTSTYLAVIKFQEKYASEILAPFGLSSGTSYVGEKTRAKLNIIYGCPKLPLVIISPNGGETWISIDHVTDTASGNEKYLQSIKWTGGSNPNSTNSVDAYLEQLVNGQYEKIGRILPAGYGSIVWIVGVVSNPNCTYPDGVGNLPIPSDYCWLKTNMKVVPSGQYYVHLIDRITKSEDRNDAPFSIVPTISSCTRNAPKITINPNSQSGNPGTILTYTINVTNTDTAACSSSDIALMYTSYCPSGWTCALTPAITYSLTPGATFSNTLKVTSPTSSLPGSYTMTLVAANLQSGLTSTGGKIEYIVPWTAAITPPSVATLPYSNVSASSATFNGNITATNGQNADLRGFDIGNIYGTYNLSGYTEGTAGNYTYGVGAFSWTNSGLNPGTTYYVRAKAHNSAGWKYGEMWAFSTSATSCTHKAPTVSFSPASQSGTPGKFLVYNIGTTNNNTADCAPAEVNLSVTNCPAGWICTLGLSSYIEQFISRSTGIGLFVTSPVSASPGQYNITVQIAYVSSSLKTTQTVTAVYNVTSGFLNYTLSVIKAGTGTGTVISSPAGIGCGATCSSNYTSGTSVTLAAGPAIGSTFAGWSGGGCSGTRDCNVIMDSNKTTTATFNTSGGGSGCPILKAWNGNQFKEIELLNIHAPKDQDTTYASSFSMQPKDGKYELILHEAAYHFWDGSHINSVKLIDSTGKNCHLISAIHSKDGDVLKDLLNSDDIRTRTYPEDEIKLVFDGCSGTDFTFTIEGYNMKTTSAPSNLSVIESMLASISNAISQIMTEIIKLKGF